MEDRYDLNDFDADSGPDDEPPGHDVIVLFAVFFEGGLAPLSLILGWWLGHAPLLQFAWNLRDALIGAVAAVPPVLAFMGMLRWPIGPFARLKKFCEEEFVPLLANSSWSDITLIAISAGVGEEMLFRGVFQSALTSSTGVVPGLLLASLLFGLLHPISLFYAIVSFSMGMYLGDAVSGLRQPADRDGGACLLRLSVDGLPAAHQQPRQAPLQPHRRDRF